MPNVREEYERSGGGEVLEVTDFGGESGVPCLGALQLGLQVTDPSPQLPVLHFLVEDFVLVGLRYTLLQITPDLLQTVHGSIQRP